jgi:hypothetical protein
MKIGVPMKRKHCSLICDRVEREELPYLVIALLPYFKW